MVTRKTLLCLLFALAVPSVSPSSAQQAGGTAAKTVVKVGTVGRPDMAAFELAYRRGYFTRQGIEIETVPASSGQEFAAALATNQVQVASGVPNAALFNALNRGIDIRLVADQAHVGDADDRTVTIVVRAELMDTGVVKRPSDLKGRAVSTGPLPGQYPDVLLDKLLASAGLDAADVEVRHIGFADALAALASKRLDAAFMIEPLAAQAERQNIARVLVRGGVLDPGAQLSVLQYSPEFARQTDVATRFMVAFLEGVRDYHDAIFLKQDRDAAIAILTRQTSLKDAKLWEESMFRNTDLNGRINVADLRSQAAFYKKQGTLSGPIPDIDKYVDPSFAAAAVKLIGAR
jgi:NitT/TauT family transport system substrate-binding protein